MKCQEAPVRAAEQQPDLALPFQKARTTDEPKPNYTAAELTGPPHSPLSCSVAMVIAGEAGVRSWRVVLHDTLPTRLAKLGVAGGAVYDALIALTTRAAGVELVTLDRRALGIYERCGASTRLLIGDIPAARAES